VTADAASIQQAINQAARLTGQRPVVHLPMGAYKIDHTLVIPPACDVQLVGDGASEIATRLLWAGPADGVLLRVDGPSRATIRDLQIQAGASSAMLVESPDQPDARIFADQLNTNGPTGQTDGRSAALRVAGFERTHIQFRALQGSGNRGTWVEVVGRGGRAAGQAVGVFTGATGTAAGQYDVRQGGRLVVRGVYHERSSDSLNGLHLTDSGELSIDATRFSYATSEKSPTVAADNFRGLFTLATCMLMPVETQETCRFELRGDGSQTSVLALNDQFWVQKPGTSADTVWLNRAQPPAKGGLIGSNINTSNKDASPRGFEFLENIPKKSAGNPDRASGHVSTSERAKNVGENPDPARSKFGSAPLADRGGVDDATIVRHLAPLRSTRPWVPAAVPAGTTDLSIHRVITSGGRGATVEVRATK
jgi:hypothetical protein